MKKIPRFVIWICNKFNRDEILNIVVELIEILENKNPNVKPKDDFKEKHPNYRDFKVDPLAPLNEAQIVKPGFELDFKILRAEYEKQHGKPLKPIKLRNNSNALSKILACPHCSAPHDYVYYNDGKKRSQLKCKVCSNTFPLKKRFRKKTKYFCPYCHKALFSWKERSEVTIYKCGNRNCPHRLREIQKLNSREANLRKERSS